MIPGEHVLGFVRLQEAVAASRAALVVMARSAPKANTARPSNEAELSSMKMSKDPGTDRVLEALQEFGGEGGGFVKTEAVGGIGWILVGITLDQDPSSIRG